MKRKQNTATENTLVETEITENTGPKLLIICREKADLAELKREQLSARFPSATIIVLEYIAGDGTFKFPAIKKHIEENDLLNKYDYYMFSDADVIFGETAETEVLICLSENPDIDIIHPAITPKENTSWRPLQVGAKEYEERFTEIMCPIFSNKALLKCIETFSICYSGWGLNFVWATLCTTHISQSFIIEHPTKANSNTWQLPNGKRPIDELSEILEKYNLTFPRHLHAR